MPRLLSRAPVLADFVVWHLSLLVAFALRPLLPTPFGVPAGGFVNTDNVIGGIVAGSTWIVARAIARECCGHALRFHGRMALSAIVALWPLVVVRMLFANILNVSQLLLLVAVLLAGILWGISTLNDRAASPR